MEQPPGGPPAEGKPPEGKPSGWGEMKGKLAAAKGPDRLIVIAGILFFVTTFLPWYTVKVSAFGRVFARASENAWGLGALGLLAALLGLAATGLAASLVLGVEMKPSAQSQGALALGLGAGTVLFTLLRLIVNPAGTEAVALLSQGAVRVSRGIGLYLALVLAIALAYGGYQKFQAAKAA